MKLAVFSDVHGNLEALSAVMRDIESRKIEKLFFLGDAVGYGADPNKCVEIIDAMCEIKLLGNHDYVALGLESARHFNPMAQQSIYWTQNELSSESKRRLSDFDMDGTYLDYYMVHATPEEPSEWNYILDPRDALRNFEYFSQSMCIVGHSHIPCIFMLKEGGSISMQENPTSFTAERGNRYIVNTGSVGQPRDGVSDACYLMIDTDLQSFEYIRVPYELELAQRKMKEAQLPDYLITRLANGK